MAAGSWCLRQRPQCLFGGSADTVLFNIDNSIRGAGQPAPGSRILNNAGSIIADGSHAPVIDTGDEVIINPACWQRPGPVV